MSLCICVFDYKNESERQDTIFINNIRDYYLWLQSFKDNLSALAGSSSIKDELITIADQALNVKSIKSIYKQIEDLQKANT